VNPLRLAVPAEMLQEHFHLEPISAFKIKPGSCRKQIGFAGGDANPRFFLTKDDYFWGGSPFGHFKITCVMLGSVKSS
jgi:hypothetical protein